MSMALPWLWCLGMGGEFDQTWNWIISMYNHCHQSYLCFWVDPLHLVVYVDHYSMLIPEGCLGLYPSNDTHWHSIHLKALWTCRTLKTHICCQSLSDLDLVTDTIRVFQENYFEGEQLYSMSISDYNLIMSTRFIQISSLLQMAIVNKNLLICSIWAISHQQTPWV